MSNVPKQSFDIKEGQKPKVFIVFYTTYLHVYKLALAIKEGIEKEGNCEAHLYQIAETLPPEVQKKIRAPPKPDVPIITPQLLKSADGILFGFPTRYGTLPAQLKEFFDACGQLWATEALDGKMAGAFVSTATQHGGQETSFFSLLSTLAHFGILYVPLGYASPHLNNDSVIMGGGPWGASISAGKDGTRQPSTEELEIARIQGENFSKVLSQYHSENKATSEPVYIKGDFPVSNQSIPKNVSVEEVQKTEAPQIDESIIASVVNDPLELEKSEDVLLLSEKAQYNEAAPPVAAALVSDRNIGEDVAPDNNEGTHPVATAEVTDKSVGEDVTPDNIEVLANEAKPPQDENSNNLAPLAGAAVILAGFSADGVADKIKDDSSDKASGPSSSNVGAPTIDPTWEEEKGAQSPLEAAIAETFMSNMGENSESSQGTEVKGKTFIPVPADIAKAADCTSGDVVCVGKENTNDNNLESQKSVPEIVVDQANVEEKGTDEAPAPEPVSVVEDKKDDKAGLGETAGVAIAVAVASAATKLATSTSESSSNVKSPDIDSRGLMASKAFNKDPSVDTEVQGSSAPPPVVEDVTIPMEGSSKDVSSSKIQPKIMEMPLPVTATEASGFQNPPTPSISQPADSNVASASKDGAEDKPAGKGSHGRSKSFAKTSATNLRKFFKTLTIRSKPNEAPK